jgi:hypothetical protein
VAIRDLKTTASKPSETSKQRAQKTWREKQEEAGRKQLSIYVPRVYFKTIKMFSENVRGGKKLHEAFELAFPKAAEKLKNKPNKTKE